MKTDESKKGFAISVTGSMAGVREALTQIRSRLIDLGIGDDTCSTVELVLAEAMNNIAEHAYGSEHPGQLDISARISPSLLRFDLQDYGRPLPDQKLPYGKLPDNNVPVHDLPEGGFGWFLIRTLAASVQYRHENGKNLLSLSFPRKKAGKCNL